MKEKKLIVLELPLVLMSLRGLNSLLVVALASDRRTFPFIQPVSINISKDNAMSLRWETSWKSDNCRAMPDAGYIFLFGNVIKTIKKLPSIQSTNLRGGLSMSIH